MPDICMCSGSKRVGDDLHTCPRAKTCWRYTATPSEGRQSWFMVAPLTDGGECEHYYPTTMPVEASLPEEK